MILHTTTFLKKEIIAKNTYSLYFKKPKDFVFHAGQYVLLNANPSSATKDYSRFLSICNAPHEERLQFIVRVGDSVFKKRLLDMKKGDEVTIEGPRGKFILPDLSTFKQSLVFVAGGVGIAPFVSILRDIAYTKQATPSITLFYSNRTKEEAPLIEEITEFASTIPQLKIIKTLTREEHEGEKGRIDKAMITRSVSNPKDSFYYIVGIQPMVASIETDIKELGVDQTSIKTEKYCGYAGYVCAHCKEAYGLV